MISVDKLASETVSRICAWVSDGSMPDAIREIIQIEVLVALGRFSVELANAQAGEADAMASRMRAIAEAQSASLRAMETAVASARGAVLAASRDPIAVA